VCDCVRACMCVLLLEMHHYHIIKVGEQCVYCAVRTEFLDIMWTALFYSAPLHMLPTLYFMFAWREIL